MDNIMIKQGTKNSVLVELEKIGEDEYKLSSGVKLFINTRYAPKQMGNLQLDVDANNQRIYGECVAAPEILTKGDLVKYEVDDLRYTDSIIPEVKPGDRVYFSYTAAHKGSILEYEGKTYCNIPYTEILCVVRIFESYNTVSGWGNGYMIIPIGGYILLEEYYGKDTTSVDVGGKKVVGQVSSSGLVTTLIKKPSERYGIVRITGTPLKGDSIDVETGDIVMFPNKFGFKNNIEGTDYLFVRYWDIQAIVGNEKESLV